MTNGLTPAPSTAISILLAVSARTTLSCWLKWLGAGVSLSHGLLAVFVSQVPVALAVFQVRRTPLRAEKVRSSTASQSSASVSLLSFQRNVITCPGFQVKPPMVAVISRLLPSALPSSATALLGAGAVFGDVKLSSAAFVYVPVRMSVASVLYENAKTPAAACVPRRHCSPV